MRTPLEIALAAILAGGHVLFEDVPGLGQDAGRPQPGRHPRPGVPPPAVHPDLLPADITGSYVFDPAEGRFGFRPGPVFTGLLLADEINRTAPKTQSALLEAMAERQVTVEGTSFGLAQPFHVHGHLEPGRVRGHLPAAGGPAGPLHGAAGGRLPRRRAPRPTCCTAGSPPDGGRASVGRRRRRHGPADAGRRGDGRRSIPTSSTTAWPWPPAPGVTRRSRWAPHRAARSPCCWCPGPGPCCAGRDFVLPEDVKKVAVSALAHRITLNPQTWATGVLASDVVGHRAGPGARPGRRAPLPPLMAPNRRDGRGASRRGDSRRRCSAGEWPAS